MKKWLLLALVTFSLSILAACTALPCQPATLPPQTFDPATIKSINVNVDSGSVSVTGTKDKVIALSGSQGCMQGSTLRVSSANDALIVTGAAQKHLFQHSTDTQVEIDLKVPVGIPLQVTTDDANVSLLQYNGKLKVDSVAGNITAQALSGEAQLRSGRGNVTLGDSSGVFHVLGEHGILDIESSHGSIDSSTIMGTIQYQGTPGTGDSIHFEVDHGPITIALGKDSDLTMIASSTSGDVACMVPGLLQSGRGCSGVLDKGSATFYIRTVSGSITIQ
jgi:DUF4097 and DUF4098 domain-containing protein YvlB